MQHEMNASQDPVTSFPKNRIKVLLLEGIHTSAHELVEREGFQLEFSKAAPSEQELVEKIASVHVLGIRSKTELTDRVLEAGKKLLSIGCFCIGTNQVDLASAKRHGIPVFNAPFSNTRSVAELVMAEVIMLSRCLGDRVGEMHRGVWRKVAGGSYEVRGKTLGIVGYGHIGTQVGILAEALGMRVLFYDIAPRLPIGNNAAVETLQTLLAQSDFVTLHVPATQQTHRMIGAQEVAAMRPGAFLLNLSRGSVVDVAAVAEALRSGHLAGAAVDVFPEEPKHNDEPFASELQGLPNVVLTPHVGGSTEEAQAAIGREVMGALIRFVNTGSTTGAVNFPLVEPPPLLGRHRILNVHRNVPGVLSRINGIVSEVSANVESQVLATDPTIGYLVMDLNRHVSEDVRAQVAALDTSIRTRILF
jgi:D-3-phosphoglycerate dehydrogenase / 2-oxoglutarate reductase